MSDQRNMLLAIVLSVVVLLGWQYFIAGPQLEKQKQAQQQQQQQKQTQAPQGPQVPPATTGPQTPNAGPQTPPAQGPQVPGTPQKPATATRAQILAASGPRVLIETPKLHGSISLKGARIDDVTLNDYRETVDPKSDNIVLLAPSGSPLPFYAEFGWVGVDQKVKTPNAETVWTRDGAGPLTPEKPLRLTWDNGEGLVFTRTISIDPQYMFKIVDEVENRTQNPVQLFPYGLVSRHGTPKVLGYYILHEGLIGVTGEAKLHEITYANIVDKPAQTLKSNGGWLGITDKYWAAALIPPQNANTTMRFSSSAIGPVKTYQTDYLLDAVTVAPNAKANTEAKLFAGAKETAIIDNYEKTQGVKSFELMIDWGWFYFITKPLFKLIDYFYRLFGNFGLAILIATVLIKIAFLWFANKSYASMAKMKMVQPMMEEIRKRYADDKVAQQQALMELYKKEKINPLAGCLPILIQIPVFFALYKVLFVTIEMRHAPFFGWIRDLSAPDPTNLFNLFGLLPFDPTVIPVFGQFLHLGIWPILMGITMWAQMKMNPSPPDPTQKMIFDWMPLIFTFLLASFPAGLVIYWTWNNLLSVIQQGFIMKRHGAKIELGDNLRSLFRRKKPADS
ncbi:MAG: membrane protein insertase YidC [Xanthobacteraceae bacterium]|nr:membrane protein insertase YidC [Xanthobacteraceae bacterium]QYK45313.1 MAG: membrane protein insertase YidC [Xanthobacteraceae bacterium]